jgi:hypothetical protein
MADYYPLIARAVTGLDKSTGEARRALYERARTALVTQLRGVEPALSEADITRERLALEEAIRKVEGEAARRPRSETPPPESSPAPRMEIPPTPQMEIPPPPPRAEKPAPLTPPPPPPLPPPPPPPPPPEPSRADLPPEPDWNELRRELDGLEASEPQRSDVREPDTDGLEPSLPDRSADEPPLPLGMDTHEEPAPSMKPPARPQRFAKGSSGERTSLVDEGLKGFRDVMAETDDLGEAAASAAKAARDAREAFAAFPPSGEVERVEPRFGAEDLMPPAQDFPPPPPRTGPPAGARQRPVPRPHPEDFEEPGEQRLRPGFGGGARKFAALAIILALAVLAFFVYREWGTVSGLFQSARTPVTQASKDAPQARPKISDRIGGAQQDTGARPSAGSAAAVAQRVVLYEQQANTQERKQYVGSVIWRTETASPGPGQPPDVAVKAEVEIPERHIRMSFTVRRNLEQSLPASHTIEVLFSTPADFPPGGIADVPGVLMEDNEQRGGAPLTGLRVKVTNGFFLIGLSSVESDVRRNVQLLKERAWLHMPVVYNNGQRALLAMEKGVPGDRVFEEALNAWAQSLPQRR